MGGKPEAIGREGDAVGPDEAPRHDRRHRLRAVLPRRVDRPLLPNGWPGGHRLLLCGMLAIFCSMTAYTEYTGQMEGKLFALYHYFLSVVVTFWMLQPSTSDLGKLFFAAPLAFTAWCVYIVVTKDKTD